MMMLADTLAWEDFYPLITTGRSAIHEPRFLQVSLPPVLGRSIKDRIVGDR